MLQKLRNYVTPMVATIALAVLGATALAVPNIAERFANDGDSETLAGQKAPDVNETADVREGVEDNDLIIEEADLEEGEVTTPTATPANEKPNHGHYVSCVARMAKNDPTLQKGQKGAVVSFAAKQDVVMPKGEDCSTAYAAARTAALAESEQVGDEEQAGQSSVKQEKRVEKQVRREQAPNAANAQVQKNVDQGQGASPGGPPARLGGHPSQNGKGSGSQK